MPALLVNAYKSGSMLDGRVQALSLMSRDEIIQLIQWTDMIVFDYITGHYDRYKSKESPPHPSPLPSPRGDGAQWRYIYCPLYSRDYFVLSMNNDFTDSYVKFLLINYKHKHSGNESKPLH